MLVIRSAQMQAFRQEALAQFEDKMVQHAAVVYPEQFKTLTEPGVRQVVKHAIKVGNNHGIRTDEAVAGLVELMMELGRNFELALDSAWIRDTLEDEGLPPELKIGVIRERLAQETGGRPIEVFDETGQGT